MQKKITKRSVEVVAPFARDSLLWDTELPGFGVKVTPKGRRVYVFQYWHAGGSRRCTIGEHGAVGQDGEELTAEKARAEATHLRGLVAKGQDPAAARAWTRGMPTVAEFADRYLSEHAERHKKARSAQEDRSLVDNHIKPLLGRAKVGEVSRQMVAKALRDIVDGKTARDEKTKRRGRRIVRGGAVPANRTAAVLSKMFNLAEMWGLRPDGSNPCRHVERYAERKRERFLSSAELAHVGAALAAAEREKTLDRTRLAAIRLLVFTGCRLREILDLHWEHVDLERRLLRLPESKTGAKAVYLSAPALKVLADLEGRAGVAHVLPRRGADRPLSGLQNAWERIRERASVAIWAGSDDRRVAGITAALRRRLDREPTAEECRALAREKKIELPVAVTDVRLHDLRHSFAAVGAGGGLSLPVIGALLGHTQPSTTARYAHLAANPLHQAAELIAGRIAAAFDGAPAAEVATISTDRRKRRLRAASAP